MTVAAVPVSRPPSLRRLLLAAAISSVLHLALALALLFNASRPPQRHPPNNITLEVHEVERPKPPPPPPPKVIPAEKVPRVVIKQVEKPPPVATPPPTQTPAKPDSKPPPPIRIGVNLESTVPGGDFAAPVGNTMYGQAPPKATPPVEAKPYWAAKYVPAAQVASLPVQLGDCQVPYPPEARKLNIEGDVILMVTVDEQGSVAKVRKVTGVGHGLDEAAIGALKQCKFKPAHYNGESVATEIRYVYSWEID